MIDTWMKSMDKSLLDELKESYQNTIGVLKGRAATEEQTVEEGIVIHAQESAGDPSFYYLCIRANEAVTAPDGVECILKEEGMKVLGVWADC